MFRGYTDVRAPAIELVLKGSGVAVPVWDEAGAN
jgi:hypothetical protein